MEKSGIRWNLNQKLYQFIDKDCVTVWRIIFVIDLISKEIYCNFLKLLMFLFQESSLLHFVAFVKIKPPLTKKTFSERFYQWLRKGTDIEIQRKYQQKMKKKGRNCTIWSALNHKLVFVWLASFHFNWLLLLKSALFCANCCKKFHCKVWWTWELIQMHIVG